MDENALRELVIGIDEIDAQHREFLKHLAGLRDSLVRGEGGRDHLMDALDFLDDFVSRHFATEVKYMRRYNYPGILLHEQEHESFSKRFAELKRKVLEYDRRGEIMSFLAIEVERQLEHWLQDHILQIDKKMGEFLAEHM